MTKWTVCLFFLAGLLLASCAPGCTEENKARFTSEVKRIGNAWEVVEFNVAYSPEAKVTQLGQLRKQAEGLYTPVCTDRMKMLLLQSMDERAQNIGNYDNKPRIISDYFQNEFITFQKTPIDKLNQDMSLLNNATLRAWVLVDLFILMVVLSVGFGAYFFMQQRNFSLSGWLSRRNKT